jgi:hypothetical protein
MTAYLDVAGFQLRTVMPFEDVDFLESNHSGFLDARLEVGTSIINARLAKRYAVPFEDPVPEIVLGWLVAIVTPKAYQKRGWNPSDQQSAQILADATEALEQMKEAADSEVGLFDLPVRADLEDTSGVSKGGPLGYTEMSPYVWTDLQVEVGSIEDGNS